MSDLEHLMCPVLVRYHNLPNEHYFGRLWGSVRCMLSNNITLA